MVAYIKEPASDVRVVLDVDVCVLGGRFKIRLARV